MQNHFFLLVAMHREKEELVDGPYRRDFLTYDNHILDGEIFLQNMEKYFYKRWRNIADQGNMQAVLVQAATITIWRF